MALPRLHAVAGLVLLSLAAAGGCKRPGQPDESEVTSSRAAGSVHAGKPWPKPPTAPPAATAASSSSPAGQHEMSEEEAEEQEAERAHSRCRGDQLTKVRAAIRRLDADPRDLTIESLDHPLAEAHTALLRWTRGDRPGAERALARIPLDVRRSAEALPNPAPSTEQWMLSVLRAAAYLYGFDCVPTAPPTADIWCGVFDSHPREALAVFVPLGSVAADDYSSAIERQCTKRSLTSHASPAIAADYDAAVRSLLSELSAIAAPPPRSGYWSGRYRVQGLLQAELLVVAAAPPSENTPEGLTAAVADAGRYLGGLEQKLARFRQHEAKLTAPIGAATCAMARYRDVALSDEACRQRALGRMERALQLWLEARPYAIPRVDAKGNLIEPKILH